MRYSLRHINLSTSSQFLRDQNVEVRALLGNPDTSLFGYPYLRPLDDAHLGSVSFLYLNKDKENFDPVRALRESEATLILADARLLQVEAIEGKTIALVDDPKTCFMEILLRLAEPFYPFTYTSSQPLWGPNVFVEVGATIGKNVILEGNNFIHANCRIGDNVVIKAGAVIGGCGYGFLTVGGEHRLLPHIGGVVIEDDVLIGSNTCIDCGLLGDTVIRRGARIDNLVHIAHNVIVGENAMVIANAMIAGSVKIGRGAQISPSVSIRQQLVIGDDAVVGMHSCVTKGVEAGSLVYGVPAKPFGSSQSKKLEDNK